MKEMKQIEISLIIPVYNAEKYLERCIASIKNQTYNNYEVILVNDGSIDASERICKEYQQEDDRVRYIYQENAGVAEARNNGIRSARGKYIALLDNDDYINPCFLEKITEYDNEDAEVLLFQFENVFSDNDIQNNLKNKKSITEVETFENQGDYLQREMFCPTSESIKKSTIVFPWGKAYKREFLINNNLFFDSNIKLCEDVYLNLSVYEKANKVVYIHYPAYYYFHNIESAGKGFNPKVVEMETNNIKLLDEFVYSKKRTKEYLRAYDNCLCFRYWSCCFSYFVHPENSKKLSDIVYEMKAFERETNIRRAFYTLPFIRKSMELKEWIFLMAIKFYLHLPMLYLARMKMRKGRER